MNAVNGQRRLQLGGQQIDYTLQRSTRRTIGFVIGDSGLRVTAPRWVLVGDIEQAIRVKEAWILAKLQQRHEHAAERARQQMEWRDGARLPYLGGALTLRLRPASTPAVAVHHDASTGELAVHLPDGAEEQALKDTVREWLQRQAHALFAQRLPHYAMQLGVQYRAFRLTSARTQWGCGTCCSSPEIRARSPVVIMIPTAIPAAMSRAWRTDASGRARAGPARSWTCPMAK